MNNLSIYFIYLFFYHFQCHPTPNCWISTCWELKFFRLGADSDTLGDFLYKQREGRSGGSCSGEVVLCGWIRAGLIIAIFWD